MTNGTQSREVVADRDFKYSEKKIIRRLTATLGLGPAELKHLLNNLVEGEHWKKNGRSEVHLTATAVRMICAGCDTKPEFIVVGDCTVSEPPKEKNTARPLLCLPPSPIKMRVVRKMLNPRVLDAADPSGKICHVFVGDSQPYAYDAEFTALPSRAHKGFYEVVEPPAFDRWTR